MKRLLIIAIVLLFEGCSRRVCNNAKNTFIVAQAEVGRSGIGYFCAISTNNEGSIWFYDRASKFKIGDTISFTIKTNPNE